MFRCGVQFALESKLWEGRGRALGHVRLTEQRQLGYTSEIRCLPGPLTGLCEGRKPCCVSHSCLESRVDGTGRAEVWGPVEAQEGRGL